MKLEPNFLVILGIAVIIIFAIGLTLDIMENKAATEFCKDLGFEGYTENKIKAKTRCYRFVPCEDIIGECMEETGWIRR